MRILIVGLNYAPERVGIAVYTTGMAEALVARGHEVRVIAGQPYYPAWKIMNGYSSWTWTRRTENCVRVTRVPHYIPRRPTGLKRLIHHATFALSSLAPALWQSLTFRPDVVLAVAPSLVAAPVARLVAWSAGAQSWLHIQDFEVEAAFATGLLKGDGLGARLAKAFEAAVVKSFHRVSAISPEMCRKLVQKGVLRAKITEFRNWADVNAVRPMSGPSPYRTTWGITTPHVAMYSGNIANKQGIEVVIDAARQLSRREDITFVICGEGPNLAKLRTMAADLANVQFHDLQPKERLNDLMGLATIHLLPQLAGAADLVLPSKLTSILASGRPVVAIAASGTGLAREVEGCGVVVAPGDSGAFADAIVALADNQDGWGVAAAAARHRAEERWAGDVVLARFAATMETGDNGTQAVAQFSGSE